MESLGVEIVSQSSGIFQLTGVRGIRGACFVGAGVCLLQTMNVGIVSWWFLGTVVLTVAWIAHIIWGGNLVRNGRFTQECTYWGTGHLEDRMRNGNFPEQKAQLPLRLSPLVKAKGDKKRIICKTNATWEINPNIYRETRIRRWFRIRGASFRFEHGSPPNDHQWSSLAQRLHGLDPKSEHELTFWAMADSKHPEPFFAVVGWEWKAANKRYVENSNEWRPYSLRFNPGSLDYAEIRFVAQAEGSFRITDVKVRGPIWRRAS